MALSKSSQRQARTALDEKLALQVPSREILESLAVECAANPSPDNTFQYAFCLSKSMENSELQYSITILDSLVKEGYEHQLDCMFGAAIALYLLRNFEGARVSAYLRSHLQSWLVLLTKSFKVEGYPMYHVDKMFIKCD
jgi:fission 1 protein